MDFVVPTAMISPLETAMASAFGWAGAIVRTFAFMIISSAAAAKLWAGIARSKT
jgi:hypothetical protein